MNLDRAEQARLALLAEGDRWKTRAERAEALADKLAEALRLTQEYLGRDELPALPGWSWFDALEAYKEARRDQ